jgi:hypothetical protein
VSNIDQTAKREPATVEVRIDTFERSGLDHSLSAFAVALGREEWLSPDPAWARCPWFAQDLGARPWFRGKDDPRKFRRMEG